MLIKARAYGKRLTVGTAFENGDDIEFIPYETSVVYKSPNTAAHYPVCIDLPRPRTFNTIDELLDAVDAYIIEKEIPPNER